MATIITENGVPIMDSFTAKRTEAMPKASLFGSALEIQDEERLQNMRKIDAKAHQAAVMKKRAAPKYTLPDEVKAQLQGAHVLEKSRKEHNDQLEIVNKTREELRQKEQQALEFSVDAAGDQQPRTTRASNTQRWFSEKDLEGSRNINVIGLNKNQSYNRDKYGSKAPVHQYSLIGDIMKPGMDFPRRERTEIQMRNQGYGKGDLRGILAEGNKSPSPSRGSQSARLPGHPMLNLPPNIKHKYGSKVCDKLLSDKDTVEKTMRKQQEIKESTKRPSQPFEVPRFTKELKPEYEMLGNALRMNVCPGYTMNHKISTTKTAFNDQVHLFRHPDPDKWRYQRDELSTWSEQDVIRQRLFKSWDVYMDSSPKAQPNWERGAPRPTTGPSTSQPKSAKPQKRKPQPKKQGENDPPAFEDFKFETPPITPPPKPLSPLIQPDEGVKRDDEFWEFYDKS